MTIYATITDLTSGEILERLGPFESAAAARSACGAHAGDLLTWQRDRGSWEAIAGERAYQVPREYVEEE